MKVSRFPENPIVRPHMDARMGDNVNGRFLNAVGVFYLVLLLAVAVATIPLMIITKAGA